MLTIPSLYIWGIVQRHMFALDLIDNPVYHSFVVVVNGVDNFGIVQTHIFALDLVDNPKLIVLPFVVVCKLGRKM